MLVASVEWIYHWYGLLTEEETNASSKKVEFNFLVNDEILHSKLSEHLLANKIPIEHDICIEYVEAVPPPEPLDCLEHDDWVSAVHVLEKW